MGATGWSYFVPYEADVSAALERLREDVFNRGDYIYGDEITDDQREATLEKVRPEVEPWVKRIREEAAKLQEPLRTLYLQGAENFKKEVMAGSPAPRKPTGQPKTIEEALEAQAESGTHSILDIAGVSSEPAFGYVRPFPPESLSSSSVPRLPATLRLRRRTISVRLRISCQSAGRASISLPTATVHHLRYFSLDVLEIEDETIAQPKHSADESQPFRSLWFRALLAAGSHC